MHYLLLFFFIIFISGCQSQKVYTYNHQGNALNFQLSKNSSYEQPLSSFATYSRTYDRCTSGSYIIKDKNYFVEHIVLDMNCSWSGLPRGFFEYNYKRTLKLNSMKIIDKIRVSNYEFITYKINNQYILNLIHSYSSFSNTFILDYDGEFFYNLLAAMKREEVYVNNSLPRFKADYKKSLVQLNFFYNYFKKEIPRVIEK